MEMKRFFERPKLEGRLWRGRTAIRGGAGPDQERIHSRAGDKAVVQAGALAEGTDAELGKAMTDFFSQRTEVGDDHLRLALKPGAQLFGLRGDPHRAGIEMALARHDAPDGEERSGAKTEFVGAENSGKDDVAGEFQASVHAERET